MENSSLENENNLAFFDSSKKTCFKLLKREIRKQLQLNLVNFFFL